jgi:hypothetical protein
MPHDIEKYKLFFTLKGYEVSIVRQGGTRWYACALNKDTQKFAYSLRETKDSAILDLIQKVKFVEGL